MEIVEKMQENSQILQDSARCRDVLEKGDLKLVVEDLKRSWEKEKVVEEKLEEEEEEEEEVVDDDTHIKWQKNKDDDGGTFVLHWTDSRNKRRRDATKFHVPGVDIFGVPNPRDKLCSEKKKMRKRGALLQ